MIKMKKHPEISALVALFLDGATTPAQEKVIYSYFASHADAGELERYRPMFEWYASLPCAEPERKPSRSRRMSARLAAAAAVVAAVVATAFVWFTPAERGHDESLYAVYQGSYMVRDGKRITDISAIYSQIVSAEATADSLWMLTDPEYGEIDEAIIDNALRGISDPETAQRLRNEMLGNS